MCLDRGFDPDDDARNAVRAWKLGELCVLCFMCQSVLTVRMCVPECSSFVAASIWRGRLSVRQLMEACSRVAAVRAAWAPLEVHGGAAGCCLPGGVVGWGATAYLHFLNVQMHCVGLFSRRGGFAGLSMIQAAASPFCMLLSSVSVSNRGLTENPERCGFTC